MGTRNAGYSLKVQYSLFHWEISINCRDFMLGSVEQRGCLKNRKFKIFVNWYLLLWPRNALQLRILA